MKRGCDSRSFARPIELELSYATDLFDEETARRLRGYLATVVERVVAALGAAISTDDPLPREERRRLTGPWASHDDDPAELRGCRRSISW
jgi:hypothetical protein